MCVSFTGWLGGVGMLGDLSRGQSRRTNRFTRFGWGIKWQWVAILLLTTIADEVTGVEKSQERASMDDNEQNNKK